jgi:gliding motility associated protien GldN
MLRLLAVIALLCSSWGLTAQPIPITTESDQTVPLNDIVVRASMQEKRVLAYPPVREADIMWEKRVWRELDTRQKINLPFRYPDMPLFTILEQAIRDNQLTAYKANNDKFTDVLTEEELNNLLFNRDTVEIIDPVTYEVRYEIVDNNINPEDIIKYRLKEVWFVDTRHSRMDVRILGLAPIITVKDDNGNPLYEKPLFWIHYPSARETLARHKVFNPANDASVMSWEDHLEMRFFDSYITKVSNVNDRRLQDYLVGEGLLQKSQLIEESVFNYEMDLWSN